eukprot:NODE_15_length_42055_cov_0.634117.p13 type:complete len:292 gc:universal NODE_15_length_42055_cov_0.634117:32779-31904(-)
MPEESTFTFQSKGEDISLWYQLHGNGKNKLMMLNGMSTNSSIWRFIIPHLKDFTICTFDLRGTGYSSTPVNYSIDIFAEDVIRIADHLKWNKFHICGVSMGGFISLKVAHKYPERVESQTLISTALKGRGIPSWTAILLLWVTNLIAIFWKSWRSYFVAPLLFPVAYLKARHSDGIRNYFHKIEEMDFAYYSRPATRFRAVVGHIASSFYFKLKSREIETIRKLKIPSVVIGGDSDILIRPQFTAAVACNLEYPLYLFRGVGHAPISQGDAPLRIAKIIQNHVVSLETKTE